MRNKEAIFVVPKHRKGEESPQSTIVVFYCLFYSQFQITARAGFSFSVTGNQSCWPLRGFGAEHRGLRFFYLTYQRGKDYISVQRIKRQNQMRNTNNSLDFLRELVSNPSDLIRTKRLLIEVFTTYYLSENFSEDPDDRKRDITFLMALISDLLDDLFLQTLQNPVQKPCNN